ncbi:NPCBM/NEW2 domain-containing protein [Candidatus Gottesmanbacteria bacterium]|nr:NPCBM/NEW2 domain-containing protein [Candidatus Gottesmanbacteria bacterium]
MLKRFIYILFIGLVIRLFLVGNTGFIADISFWKSWSLAAIDHGIVWTAQNTNINYPPGFIYVLWLMGKIYAFFGNPHDYYSFWRENNFGFLLASKSIAIVSDVVIACLIYWFASRFPRVIPIRQLAERNLGRQAASSRSQRLLDLSRAESRDPSTPSQSSVARDDKLGFLLSSIFFLNPVVILDSALWGQVESFGILFTIISILLLFYKKPLLATVIFTIGTLMKLQNIIFIPLYFLFIFRFFDLKTAFKSIAAATATFFLINLPFIITNNMDKVLYLLTVNSDYFPWLSLNAHNLWWIVAGTKGMQITDKITTLGILNAKTVGLLIFSSFYLLFSILVFFKPTPRNFLLAATLVIFAFFLFTTQSHERYSYPVVVLLLLFYPFIENGSNLLGKNSKFKALNPKQYQNDSQTVIPTKRSAWRDLSRMRESFLDKLRDPSTTLGMTRGVNLFGTWDFGFRISDLYFWLLYLLLTLAIFFNIHMGLVSNYPQNGLNTLTRITTPALTILNSYFLILLFFLLLPFVFSQISKWFFVLCFMFYVFSLILLNSSYLIKGKVSLTSFKPIVVKQDYELLQINKSTNSSAGWKKWNRLSNNYFYYRKGFGSHANSYLVFDIDRKFKRFATDFGVDTEADTPASVVFKIYGDGRELFASKKMGRFDFPQHTEVDVSQVKNLELIITDAGDGINSDHADWLNPVLYK